MIRRPHLASKMVSECFKPSSVTTSTSSLSKAIEPADDVNEAAEESSGMSCNDRTEPIDRRLITAGVCTMAVEVDDAYVGCGVTCMCRYLRTGFRLFKMVVGVWERERRYAIGRVTDLSQLFKAALSTRVMIRTSTGSSTATSNTEHKKRKSRLQHSNIQESIVGTM